jgi:protocatechuate 4,5-dioxygenase alpha chain
MSISDVVRTLPANKMVFDVRRDMALIARWTSDLEGLMAEYRLSEEEKDAFRRQDLKRMAELGVHPYFLTQITRLFHGSARNSQSSAAAQAYMKALVNEKAGSSR